MPTVAELVVQGLAHEEYDSARKARYFRLTSEGQERIYSAMKRNAERSIAYRKGQEDDRGERPEAEA